MPILKTSSSNIPRYSFSRDRLTDGISVSALEEVFDISGTLGRETEGEVVLVRCLRTALNRLNPALPSEAISEANDEPPGDLVPRLLARDIALLR